MYEKRYFCFVCKYFVFGFCILISFWVFMEWLGYGDYWFEGIFILMKLKYSGVFLIIFMLSLFWIVKRYSLCFIGLMYKDNFFFFLLKNYVMNVFVLYSLFEMNFNDGYIIDLKYLVLNFNVVFFDIVIEYGFGKRGCNLSCLLFLVRFSLVMFVGNFMIGFKL